MADWTNIPDTSVDPDAPVTSDLMYALRDNPVAIAQGALNAPKIASDALGIRGTSARRTTSGDFFTFNSLDRIAALHVSSFLRVLDGTATIRYRTSTNGGTTWSGYTTLASASVGATSSIVDVDFSVLVIGSGINSVQFNFSESTTGTGSASGSLSALAIRGVTP